MWSRDAEILLERIEADPDDAGAFSMLVRLYEAAGDTRDLVLLLERRLDVQRGRGAPNEALSALHLELGSRWRDHGRPDRAVLHFRKAFERDPTCVAALYAARQIYRAGGETHAVVALLRLEARAERDVNRRVALLRELADLERDTHGDLEAALAALERARQIGPRDPAVLAELAAMRLERAARHGLPGGAEEARADRRRAADLYVEIARLLPAAAAVGYLEAALDTDPGHADALVLLDQRSREAGRDVAALAPRHRAFLTAAPDAPLARSVRRTLGWLAMQRGDEDEALLLLEAIPTPRDADVTAWLEALHRARAENALRLVRAYARVARPPGDPRRAVALLRSALASAPLSSVVQAEAERTAADLDTAAPPERRLQGSRALASAYVEAAAGQASVRARSVLLARAAHLTEITESPYAGLAEVEWPSVTKRLVKAHPLAHEFKEVVLTAWTDIFETRIGGKGYRIGKEINPSPQIMGSFLHELIPLVFRDKYPGEWCRQQDKNDKDLVCLFDTAFSVEIKTSSHRSQIFGNRSYGQPSTNPSDHRKKGKSGYYLAVNFEKFSADATPRIVQIRFGWLDHTDWIAQRAATGQQARVDPRADAKKLIRLYALDVVGGDSSEP